MASLIHGGDLDDFAQMQGIVRHRLAATWTPTLSGDLRMSEAVATAKARLSIATIKARNSGAERGAVEVIADDVAVLLAAHSDLDRQLSAATPTPPTLSKDLREALHRIAVLVNRGEIEGLTSQGVEAFGCADAVITSSSQYLRDAAPDEDWLTDVIDDSLDMDWTGRVGAPAIIAAWDKRHD